MINFIALVASLARLIHDVSFGIFLFLTVLLQVPAASHAALLSGYSCFHFDESKLWSEFDVLFQQVQLLNLRSRFKANTISHDIHILQRRYFFTLLLATLHPSTSQLSKQTNHTQSSLSRETEVDCFGMH